MSKEIAFTIGPNIVLTIDRNIVRGREVRIFSLNFDTRYIITYPSMHVHLIENKGMSMFQDFSHKVVGRK